MNTAMSTVNTQRAQRQKTAAKKHQQATPCVCGTSIRAALLWLVDFFGACFVSVIDDLSFAVAVGGMVILDENIRTGWTQDFCIKGSYHIIFPMINLCFFSPASTPSHA